MVKFALCGAGRIGGGIHAANIAVHDDAELVYVYDKVKEVSESVAGRYRAKAVDNIAEILDSDIDAVLIASSTDTHLELIQAAAQAKKAILCEKPIALDTKAIKACWEQISSYRPLIQIGFNRRYDATHRQVYDLVTNGDIGEINQVMVTSRDPGPPPMEYLQVSGGLFRDQMIHDFDLVRFIIREEPVTITAIGSVLVDQEIGSLGDVDTAMVQMTTSSGVQCHINCSRRAVYGYDQRLEVFGSTGMACSTNIRENNAVLFSATAGGAQRPLKNFFLDRYAVAYQAELDDFIEAVQGLHAPAVNFSDGYRSLILADAAERSLREKTTVEIPSTDILDLP